MANRTTKTHATSWRWRLPALLALAAFTGLAALTTDAGARQKAAALPPIEMAPRVAGEPIMAIVSIGSQQVTFYDADGWIWRAPVSTGVKGRETPAGVFAVLQKNRAHRSSLYDDAEMPHMQRLTWNGVAMHGGPLPGYAASHGCVRMPYRLAKDLFDRTRIGMRVIIAPEDVAPVELSHKALFEPDAAALAAAPARAETLVRTAAEAAQTADKTQKAAAKAAREAAAVKASLPGLAKAKARADAALARADKVLAVAKVRQAARAEQLRRKTAALAAAATATAAAAATTQTDVAGAEAGVQSDAAAAKEIVRPDQVAARAGDLKLTGAAGGAAAAGALPDAVKAEAKLKREVAALAKELARADQTAARAGDQQRKAAASAAAARTKLDAAKADAGAKLDAAAAAKDLAKASADRKAETAAAAMEAKLALEPVSVYISRATQKLYVRRNTRKPWADGGEVFDASIEVPVTIRDPDKPIGTHIFTAMAPNGAGLRWTAVTIDNGDNARNALDRIDIAPDVLARIAPTALPRSSIVVSDEPLSGETNYRTEFVAVLSNQPQGGFKTRRPTVRVRAPREDSWDYRGYGGFGYIYQRGPDRQTYQRRRRGGYYRVPRNWWW